MNGRVIPGAEMNTFRLTNVIPERIIFVSRGITVYIYIYIYIFVYQSCASSADSELGRVSSGWITSSSLSEFGGS